MNNIVVCGFLIVMLHVVLAKWSEVVITWYNTGYWLVDLHSSLLVHRCLNGRAPPYLSDYSVPVAGADTRRHLRSTNRQLLAVPRYRLNTYGRRAFSVAGPTVWNSLPDLSGTRPSVRTVSDGC